MIIYLDFDGVLFDTVSIILSEAEKNNVNLKGDCKSFFESLDWKYILNSALEINDSVCVVSELKKIKNIKILTHVSSINEMEEKTLFINEKFKDIEIIFVPKKYHKSEIVNARDNILVDDSKKNIDDWNTSGGKGILFDSKSNKTIKQIIMEV